MLLSFFGWGFETVYFLIIKGEIVDRGFLTLPFCPIYGCTLIALYLLLGTPKKNTLWRNLLYLSLCFLLPTVAELSIGFLFDKAWDCRLWSYSKYKYNVCGYICLRNSILWGVMAFLFMKYLFPPIKKAVGKIPRRWSDSIAMLLFLCVTVDFLYNLFAVYGK